MESKKVPVFPRRVFGGANTSQGFVSYFDSLLRGCKKIFILKGSPGSGKSTLMRAVSEKALKNGEDYTEIICSADTGSLDGVILHGRAAAIVDGTAPHAMDAVYPLARERIINLGDCLDAGRLFERREEIISLCRRKACLYKEAYALLSAIAALRSAAFERISSVCNQAKIEAFAKRFCRRVHEGEGAQAVMPVCAFTADGLCVLSDYGAEEIISVNDLFYASALLTDAVKRQAEKEGIPFVYSPDAIMPDRVYSIYFPNAHLLLTSGAEGGRTIHMRRFADTDKVGSVRGACRLFSKGGRMLEEDAKSIFAQARGIHFEIEEHYVSCMDFEKANQLKDFVISQIFSE